MNSKQLSSTVFKLAACQLKATADKSINLKRAAAMVRSAASDYGADVIILPEMFCCPYTKDHMLAAKEFIGNCETTDD